MTVFSRTRWMVCGGLLMGGSALAQGEEPYEVVTEDVEVKGTATRPEKPDLSFKAVPYDLQTLMFTFPSGLRLMFQQDNTLPIVAITTAFDVGASNDPEGKEGLAHLLEHSWFLSQQEDYPKIWALQVDDMGCNLNAFTNYDNTVYMSVCPARELNRLLALNSHLITNPVRNLTAEQLENEIEVVRNEIRMRTENDNLPFFPLLDFISLHTYGETHPYHRPMAGDHESIRNIDLDTVNEWVGEHYKAENATIMVVGDFDASDVREVMTWVLGNMDPSLVHPKLTDELVAVAAKEGVENPDRDNPDDWWLWAMDPDNPTEMLSPEVIQAKLPIRAHEFGNFQVPERQTDEFVRYQSTVKDPTVVVTWPMPPANQGLDILMNMTGGTMDIVANGITYMNHRRVEDIDPNIKEWMGCGPIGGKHATTMICAATLKDGDKNPEHTAGRIIDQLYMAYNPDFQKFLFNEYGRVKMEMLASTLRSLDLYAAVGAGRATDIALFGHFQGRPDFHSAQMNEAMTVELAAVQGMMQTYITRDKASMFMVDPVERDDIQEVSGDGTEHYSVSNQGVTTNHVVDVNDITSESVYAAMAVPDLSALKEYKFSNGLRVVLMPHGRAPMVRASLIARGGSAEDTDNSEWFSWRFSQARGEDALEVAGQWATDRNATHEYFTLKGSSGNVDGILWMLRDRIENFEQSVRNKGDWVKDGEDAVVDDLDEVDFHVDDLIEAHINPDHPGDAFTYGDYEKLAEITGSDVQKVLDQRWQPSNATLLLVGRFDVDEVLNLAKTHFGGWEPKKGVEPYVLGDLTKPNPVGGKKVYVFDKEGVTQTEVELWCPGYYNGYEVWPEHSVLSSAMRNVAADILREGSGVVYSPQAYSSSSLVGPYVVFSAPVQNSAAFYAYETYQKILGEIETGSFDEATFRYAQWAYASSYAARFQSQDQMARLLTSYIGSGKEWSDIEKHRKLTANMNIGTLQETLGQCRDNAVVTFVGPVDEVTAQLKEGGIAHEVIDWEQRGYDMHYAWDAKGAKKAEKKRAKDKKKKEKKEAKKEAKEAKKEAKEAKEAAKKALEGGGDEADAPAEDSDASAE